VAARYQGVQVKKRKQVIDENGVYRSPVGKNCSSIAVPFNAARENLGHWTVTYCVDGSQINNLIVLRRDHFEFTVAGIDLGRMLPRNLQKKTFGPSVTHGPLVNFPAALGHGGAVTVEGIHDLRKNEVKFIFVENDNCIEQFELPFPAYILLSHIIQSEVMPVTRS
jgi:hypothetical protein